MALLFLFLLRLRLWDEVKDAAYDKHHHADRPVPRGSIRLMTIAKISIAVLLVEFVIQSAFLPDIAILFPFIILYSYLMFEEFFLGKFLRRRLFLYTLSHQFIFILYILFFFSIGKGEWYLPSTIRDVAALSTLFFLPFIYEVGRKCRHRTSTDGTVTDDTYVYQWGENRTFGVLMILFIFDILGIVNYFTFIPLTLALAIVVLIAIASLYIFWPQKILTTAPHWSMAIGLYLLAVFSSSFL